MRNLCVLVLVLVATGCATVEPLPPPPPAPKTCFLLRELGGTAGRVRKGDACAMQVPPASTFKIPHTLIALDTGARVGWDQLEAWDGTDRGAPSWNRDQTLRTALEHSVVWYFQRTAQRIGKAKMTAGLASLKYGNGQVGDNLERFWLDGPLAISPDQQAEFLERFVKRELPVKKPYMTGVDESLLQHSGYLMRGDRVPIDAVWEEPGTQLWAKTGSADAVEGSIRWLVGHAQVGERRFVFASLAVHEGPLSNEAIDLAITELKAAGILKPKR
jgi:beta-lactamase class D